MKQSTVRPKKHLGQHFLMDEQIAQKIVDALTVRETEEVVEVGPGTGVLTRFLIEQGVNFKAFDVDEDSINYLREKYPTLADKFLLRDFLREPFTDGGTIKVLGNFPYNISSQLFFKIYDHRTVVEEVVCMIQKEVAARIASKHGSKVYGILSVLLQAFFDVEYLFTVPPGVFHPPPKVDSAVIRLKRNSTATLACDESLFKRVVKEGFGKRRKTLRNALKGLNLPAEVTVLPVLDQRAEQLSVADFVALTQTIESGWKH